MIHVASIHSNGAAVTLKVFTVNSRMIFIHFFHKTFQCSNSKVLHKPPFAAMNS